MSREPLSGWDLATLFYLALPSLVFTLWWRIDLAAGLAGAWVLGMLGLLSVTTIGRSTWRHLGLAILLVALAAAWCASLGLGHWLYANDDWWTRDAVMFDLSREAWPVRYQTADGRDWLLRAPLGYYLVPAWLSARQDSLSPDHWLFAWTVAGVAMCLGGVWRQAQSGRERAAALALFMCFGGLDWLGFAIKDGQVPALGTHLEWWVKFAQYSSQTTLLAWVPNHALPGWLGMLLIWRHWRQPIMWLLGPVAVLLAMLWSPLSMLGLMPFAVAGLPWQANWRLDLRVGLGWVWRGLPWLLMAVVWWTYLTDGAQAVPGGLIRASGVVVRYLLFVGFEFALLAALLKRWQPPSSVLRCAVVVLFLLPLVRLGEANDLVMRASIPALMVLALTSAQALSAQGPWPRARLAAVVVILIGAWGATQETLRSAMRPAWAPQAATLPKAVAWTNHGVMPANYVVPLPASRAWRWMRQP